MKSDDIILTVSILLILLFVYTGLSKLVDYESFRGQMLNQPLPEGFTGQLAWSVPTTELVTALLLIIKPARMLGLVFSTVLMTIFTLYVGLILNNVFEWIPCSCGGIMESLSWKGHFVLNALFLLMSLSGLMLAIRKRYGLPKAANIISR